MRKATFIAILMPLMLAACTQCRLQPPAAKSISVMSYNLMALFDPVDQGGEYTEYSVADGSWDEARYRTRVANAASAVLGAAKGGPDILVAVEAENAKVLRDLSEKLGGYQAIISSPDEEAALGCGILSRFPVAYARAHRFEPPAGAASQAPRYMLEAGIDVEGRTLVVLAAHWKSKLGGAEDTEETRRAAAGLAKRIILQRLSDDPSAFIILAGDLNENPDEYELAGEAYPTALMPAAAGEGDWLRISGERADARYSESELVLFDPWQEFGGYSYKYAGNEERIDHLLLSPAIVGEGSLRLESFDATPPGFLVDASGTPIAWDPNRNAGYSDHLPIRVVLRLDD